MLATIPWGPRPAKFRGRPIRSHFECNGKQVNAASGLDGQIYRSFDLIKITRPRTNDVLMLVHRLRRWTNIKPPLAQRIVFAGADHAYSQIFGPNIIKADF